MDELRCSCVAFVHWAEGHALIHPSRYSEGGVLERPAVVIWVHCIGGILIGPRLVEIEMEMTVSDMFCVLHFVLLFFLDYNHHHHRHHHYIIIRQTLT